MGRPTSRDFEDELVLKFKALFDKIVDGVNKENVRGSILLLVQFMDNANVIPFLDCSLRYVYAVFLPYFFLPSHYAKCRCFSPSVPPPSSFPMMGWEGRERKGRERRKGRDCAKILPNTRTPTHRHHIQTQTQPKSDANKKDTQTLTQIIIYIIISLHIRSILSGSSTASTRTTTSPSRYLSTWSRKPHATTDGLIHMTGFHPSLGRQPSITLPRLLHHQEEQAHPRLTPPSPRRSLPWPLTTHNTMIGSTAMVRRAKASQQEGLQV